MTITLIQSCLKVKRDTGEIPTKSLQQYGVTFTPDYGVVFHQIISTRRVTF